MVCFLGLDRLGMAYLFPMVTSCHIIRVFPVQSVINVPSCPWAICMKTCRAESSSKTPFFTIHSPSSPPPVPDISESRSYMKPLSYAPLKSDVKYLAISCKLGVQLWGFTRQFEETVRRYPHQATNELHDQVKTIFFFHLKTTANSIRKKRDLWFWFEHQGVKTNSGHFLGCQPHPPASQCGHASSVSRPGLGLSMWILLKLGWGAKRVGSRSPDVASGV